MLQQEQQGQEGQQGQQGQELEPTVDWESGLADNKGMYHDIMLFDIYTIFFEFWMDISPLRTTKRFRSSGEIGQNRS